MSSTAPPAGQCTSGPNHTCQFAELLAAREYEGRYYCQAHAPIKAPGRFTPHELDQFIFQRQDDTVINLSGVLFPAFLSPFGQRYNLKGRRIEARDCTFEAGTVIHVEGGLDISESKCLGAIEIHYSGLKLKAQNVEFARDAKISCGNASRLDFTGSKVLGRFRLENILQATIELRLDDMTLALSPIITFNMPAMPQNSSFQRLNLLGTAYGVGAEAHCRSIRNRLHDNRDREQEGLFYEYEKRAKRKGLALKRYQSWVPRAVSAWYDWLAGYGQSYERALLCFIVAQLGFSLGYSIMSDRFAWGGTLDSQVIAFTLAQIAKPFELLSARRADHWPYDGVYTGGSGWWTAVTMADTVLSLTLVALFLLALRWRFRRD